ncbi:MAG: hypothetical protein DMD94_13620 [Candidatus Rokuibacteriota bacterium]|nr:MAG: hypothetical protein DMD94_13620 [Candidatus Rokubacteria bacterium]
MGVLKRIRSINPTAKVIMVTGSTDPLLAREALELGARAYVDKPFDFDDFKRVIAMALRPEITQPDDHPRTRSRPSSGHPSVGLVQAALTRLR